MLTAWIASKPRLIHSQSKQSITASDDYYSLESDQSYDETLRQFQTPPSHMRSPKASREMLRSEATVPTIRPVRQEPPLNIPQRPPEVHFEKTQTIKRKPVSSEGVVGQRAETAPIGPPTPGVDDTPYIRFAIDQLTRDEELLGPRRPETVSGTPYPMERAVQNNGLGHDAQKNRSSTHQRHSSDTVVRHPKRPSRYP